MDIMKLITGRDAREADLYKDSEAVDSLIEKLTAAKKTAEDVCENAKTAANKLNAVNGFSEYLGDVNVEGIIRNFEIIRDMIDETINKITANSEKIEAYNNAGISDKILGTVGMAFFKTAEGATSVLEDLGDGVASVYGFVAGNIQEKATGKTTIKDNVSNFVKSNWSHDMYNFYYKSDLAKASAITEDSLAAGAFKIIGSTSGYLYAGGTFAGIGKSLSGGGKIATGLGKIASSTTLGATAVAGLGGLGSGTDAGLNSGKTFNSAFGQGVIQGGAQATMAFVGGKLGERSARKQAIKAAKNESTIAKEKLEAAAENVKKLAAEDSGATQGMIDKAKNVFDDALTASQNAEANLAKANLTKSVNYQGYSDAFTKAGEKFGEAAGSTLKSGVTAIKKDISSINALRKGSVDAGIKNAEAAAAKQTFKENAKNLFTKDNPVAQIGGKTIGKVNNTIEKIAIDVSNNGINPKSTASKIVSTGSKAKASVTNFVKPENLGKVTSKIAPTIPGVAAQGVNAIGREAPKAIDQLKSNSQEKNEFEETPISGPNLKADYSVTETKTYKDKNIKDSSNGNSNKASSSSYGGQSSSYSGGGKSSSYSGGGTANSLVGTGTIKGEVKNKGTEQFRRNDNIDNKVPNTPNNNTPTTPTNPSNPTNPTPPSDQTPPTNPSNPSNPSTPTTGGNDSNAGNTVVTKPSNPGKTTTTQHTGGGYSGSSGYRGGGYSASRNNSVLSNNNTTTTSPIEDIMSDSTASIEDVTKGSKYTKIPTSSKPITTTSSGGSGGSAVIPVVAGLSAAAAAGIGAKVYMDRKKNNENGEYDEIETEDWAGEDTINLDYDDSSDTETYLDDDDDYGYQAEEQTEKYDARNNEELADLQ